MRKKDSGFAEKLLPVLLSTGMVFGLVLLSGQFMEVIRLREAMNQTARAYLLEMETVGYLQEFRAVSLQNELKEECRLEDISLTGTTVLPVSYGEGIELVIEGNMKTNLKAAIPLIYEKDIEWTVPIKIHMFSTAKH